MWMIMLSSPNMTSESSLGLRKIIFEKMKRKVNKSDTGDWFDTKLRIEHVTFLSFLYYNKM